MTAIDKRRLRLAMIGGGPGSGIGATHRQAALLDGQYDLVAGAFSGDAAKSRQMGESLYLDPARVHGSWRDLLEAEAALPADKRIDAVAIVTPNHLHYEPAKRSLEAGFHVIMDKPMTMTLDEAIDLRATAKTYNRILALTHAYAAAPMVKLARDLVRKGVLGTITKTVVECPQGWLSRLEEANSKAAAWRTDPKLAGAGCLGDIGTHASNLAETVLGRRLVRIAADVATVVPGRKADDDFTALARWEGGVRGSIQASQISAGEGNGLAIRVYGDKAGLFWRQTDMDYLIVMHQDKPWEKWARNTAYVAAMSPAAAQVSRSYSFHAEGYIEEFANIYLNASRAIRAIESGREPTELELDFPNADDGVRGMAFIAAALESSRLDAAWVDVPDY